MQSLVRTRLFGSESGVSSPIEEAQEKQVEWVRSARRVSESHPDPRFLSSGPEQVESGMVQAINLDAKYRLLFLPSGCWLSPQIAINMRIFLLIYSQVIQHIYLLIHVFICLFIREKYAF